MIKEMFNVSKYKNWMPTTRQLILDMAEAWSDTMKKRGAAWNLAKGFQEEFDELLADAKSKAAVLKVPANINTDSVDAARKAVEALKNIMKDGKKRYFLTPPLEDVDYTDLHLHIPDKIRTPGHTPTATVRIKPVHLPKGEAPFQVPIKVEYSSGDPDDLANKGIRVWMKSQPQDMPAPTHEELNKSEFLTKHDAVFTFPEEQAGWAVYFAGQIENDGKKGPWGAMSVAIIPLDPNKGVPKKGEKKQDQQD
jgi:soluble cytochrome b562